MSMNEEVFEDNPCSNHTAVVCIGCIGYKRGYLV
jgi:hypothetical protein